jgi:hypothetical protein
MINYFDYVTYLEALSADEQEREEPLLHTQPRRSHSDPRTKKARVRRAVTLASSLRHRRHRRDPVQAGSGGPVEALEQPGTDEARGDAEAAQDFGGRIGFRVQQPDQ